MKTKPARDYLGWAALAFALVVTYSAEYDLARAVGFNQWVAAAVPGALDVYCIRALRMHRDVLAAVVALIIVNALSHLIAAQLIVVNVPVIVLVSAIAPLVLYRVHALKTKAASDAVDALVVATQPSASEVQPTVQPEVQPHPAVHPEVQPEVQPEMQPHPEPDAAPIAPDAEPDAPDAVEMQPEMQADAADADDHLTRARELHSKLGRIPSLRVLQTELRIGQRRAQELKAALAV